MKGIIIVLGSANDKKGNLSPNSKNRMDRAIKEFKKNPDYKLLLTGGFGKFNTTDKPHAYYLKKYALEKGLKEDNILKIVESGNTVEDAYFSKPILDKYKPEKVFISTSNFHLPRAIYIFERILKGFNLEFIGSKEDTDNETLKKLKAHEEKSLNSLKENGIYMPNGKIIHPYTNYYV